MLSSAGADYSLCVFCRIIAHILLEWSTKMHKSSNFSSKRSSLKLVPFMTTSHRCQLTSHDVGLSCINQERCLQSILSTQKIQAALYKKYNPHKSYNLYSTKNTIHTKVTICILQKIQSTQKLQSVFYKKYNPHKRYKLHSTKSTIHTRGIHRRPWFGCDDEQVRQCKWHGDFNIHVFCVCKTFH